MVANPPESFKYLTEVGIMEQVEGKFGLKAEFVVYAVENVSPNKEGVEKAIRHFAGDKIPESKIPECVDTVLAILVIFARNLGRMPPGVG